MNPTALLLVAASAGLHATWNLLAKRAQDRVAFMFLLMAFSLVLYVGPLVWMAAHGYGFGPWYIWVASGFLQASYCYLMGRGYECGDLSQVYPLARGAAPALIALLAWPLLGETLGPVGVAGILAVIAGGFLLHTEDCRDLANGNSLRAMWQPGARLALLASVAIAGYHLTDKYGALHATSPLSYLCAMHCFLVPFLGLMTLRLRTPAAIAAEWKRNWRLVAVASVFCLVAYWMVVTAMKLAPVAYVAATRNLSILIGVVFGVAALKEQGLRWRLGGAALMLAGIAAVALAR
jgi:drug/metabolite transporter (DMT)-like permease